MTQESQIKVVYYDAERIPDDRPGAGEVPLRLFERVLGDIVAASRKHGFVGPDDVKESSDYDRCIYWVVDDQYNEERYQYVEVNKPEGFTVAWLRDVMAALSNHPHWGVGVQSIPEGFVLIFSDRLMVTGPLFLGTETVEEVARRASRQIEFDCLVRARDDATLERLGRTPELAQLPLELKHLERVTDAGLAHLARLPEVRGLCLDGAPITDEGLPRLFVLPKLEWLALGETAVADAGMPHVARLAGLKALGLGGCRITDVGLSRLKALSNLEELDIRGTGVTDVGLAHLQAFPRLTTLYLYDCQVGDAGVQHLRGLRRLEVLALADTKVSDAGIDSLASLTALKTLDVCNARISTSAAERLCKKLPNCKVEYGER